MRAYVLPDPRLQKLAGRFVWLDLDTEKPRNAPFVEKFPIDAWPTLLVIDPATEAVVLRWLGTANASQVERLMLDGERALKTTRLSAAETALAKADRSAGERDHFAAAAAYREALEQGGKGWSGRDRAAESLVQALGVDGNDEGCAEAARKLAPAMKEPAARARAAAQGLSCALSVEDAAKKQTLVQALEPIARKALAAKGVLADDRSWLYDVLASAREDAGDVAGARRIAGEWLRFLEAEGRRAPSALARSAFDGPMISAAKRLGDVKRVLPRLEASARELPEEYVPPTNLAVAYLALERPADALAAADRALSLASGPRRIRVYVLEAEALAKLDRKDEARAALEKAIAEGDAMPEASRPNGYLQRARKLLEELGGTASR
jgi:tetratricopeptide (TPR) repeat protein